MFTVYTKDDCEFCKNSKYLLTRLNQEYHELTLDEDFTREEFYEMFSDDSTFPQIVFDDYHVGGFNELKEFVGMI